MPSVVFDLEATGLLRQVREADNADRVWCGVLHDVDTREVFKYDPYNVLNYICSDLSSVSVLIGHNIIDYDLPLLKKVLGWEPKEGTVIVDTWILSQMLWPDKQKHPNCPTKAGPHSLANWGACFGRPKPEHDEWWRYTPQMLHRCSEDVEINVLLYEKIKLEGWEEGFK